MERIVKQIVLLVLVVLLLGSRQAITIIADDSIDGDEQTTEAGDFDDSDDIPSSVEKSDPDLSDVSFYCEDSWYEIVPVDSQSTDADFAKRKQSLFTATAPEKTVFTDTASAGAYLKETVLNNWDNDIDVYYQVAFDSDAYYSDPETYSQILYQEIKDISREIYQSIFEHTGAANEGDYLRYTLNGYSTTMASDSFGSASMVWRITYSIKSVISSAEERETDAAVKQLMEQLDLDGKTDYQKVTAIYDYISEHVTYDYEHLNTDYPYMYSAYAALGLVDGKQTAVCQGFSSLLYRMLLEAGVDNRIITGAVVTSEGEERHAWNIIRLHDKYYLSDVTWDSGQAPDYWRFLLGSEHFYSYESWSVDSQFVTEPFISQYPISATDYELVHVTNVSVICPAELPINQEGQLEILITPTDADIPDTEIKVIPEGIVEIDETGTVKPISTGTAKISVKTLDGGLETAAEITVLPYEDAGHVLTTFITSYTDNTNTPVVLLYPSDKADTEIMSDYRTGNKTGVLYEGSVTDTTAGTKRTETQITAEEVEDGDYKMLVYMEGKYIPAIREVTVSGEDVDLGTIDLYLYGDVNFDGAVNTRDSQQILRYYAGKTSVFDQGSEEEKQLRKTAANVTNPKQGDSDINTRDSQQILRYYAGKTSVFDEIK